MTAEEFNRYQRQIQLKNIGLEGQQKLALARVLIVGVGGLGCPVAQHLVGAGIGKIGLVDGDKVALSNLHRQTLFTTEDVDKLKVEVAKEKLNTLNPLVELAIFSKHLSKKNIDEVAAHYDYIIDGTDQFEMRYLIDNYCIREKKVFVYGSVYQFQGQMALFDFERNGVSYQTIFPNPPQKDEVPSCSENGILAPIPSIIGNMQALAVINKIIGIGKEETTSLVHYNALDQSIYKMERTK